MKKFWLAFVLVLCLQLACVLTDIDSQWACAQKGGRWHYGEYPVSSWCEIPSTAETGIPLGNEAGVIPSSTSITKENISPPPPHTCNAIMYVRAEVEVTENNEESSLRECKYKLTVTHTYKDDDLWVLHHCAIDILKPNSHLQDAYWFSDRVYYLETWEQVFTSTYFEDGQYSRKGVDRIAAVFNRPECLYLLTSPEIESISIPVKWECAP